MCIYESLVTGTIATLHTMVTMFPRS